MLVGAAGALPGRERSCASVRTLLRLRVLARLPRRQTRRWTESVSPCCSVFRCLMRRPRADCVFAHCPATDCREVVSEDIWKRVLKHNSEQLERYSSFLVHSYIELNPSLKLSTTLSFRLLPPLNWCADMPRVQVVSLSQVQQGRVLHRQRDRPSLRLRLQDVLWLQRGRAFAGQLPDGASSYCAS